MVQSRYGWAVVVLLAWGWAGLVRGDAVEDQYKQGIKLLEDGQQEEAARVFKACAGALEKQIAQKPQDASLRFRLGQTHFQLGQDEAAAKAFDEAIRLAPKEAEYHFMRGVVARFGKDFPKALAELGKACELDAKSPRYVGELASVQQEAGQMQAAAASLRKALALSPKDARLWGQLGTVQIGLGQTEPALASFQKACEVDGGYVLGQYNIGQIYQNMGKPAEALAAFQKVKKLIPDDSRARAKLVQLYQALGRIKERDAERAELVELFKQGKVEEPFYCREQFKEGGKNIIVMEYFELAGERAVRYSFNVVDEKGKPTRRISLGSYETTTQIARETGSVGPNERLFHLHEYAGESHSTHGMFKKEPTYEETRGMVVGILRGERKAISGSTVSRPTTRPK